MASRQSALLFLTPFLLLAAVCSARSPQPLCHCTSDHSCFPTAKDWSDLNYAVHGRLHRARPAAYPCHEEGYDAEACQDARDNWQDAAWRSNQIGSVQHLLWESYHADGCFINITSVCHQGSVPLYAIDVSGPNDVTMALKFVKDHNIRLVIKNTGHDYMGKSTGRDSLSLWMHNLNFIHFHDDFVPDRCSSDPVKVVTVGAGAQWGDVYKAAQQHNRVVVGAFSNTVGASGGYVQGGGHSVMSPTYRFASDNVVQFEVVTADGVYHMANLCENSDLFWALRGGGGGTFGVVLSTTYLTHDPPSNFLNVIHSVAAPNASTLRDFLAAYITLQPALSYAQWGGSFVATPGSVYISYVLPGGNTADAAKLWQPLVEFPKSHSGIQVNQTMISFPDFFTFFNATQCARFPHCSDVVGNNEILASHLIPRSIFEDSSYGLADRILDVLLETNTRANKLVLGMSVAGGKSATEEDSAMNPSWRTSLWHMIVNGEFEDGASEAVKQATFFNVSHAINFVRRLTDVHAAYLNEADYLEPDWQQSFYGDNYQRLFNLKMSLDPSHLFVCHHCVGSELWNKDLSCRS